MTGKRHVFAVLIDCEMQRAERPLDQGTIGIGQIPRQCAEREVDAALAVAGARLLLAELGKQRGLACQVVLRGLALLLGEPLLGKRARFVVGRALPVLQRALRGGFRR